MGGLNARGHATDFGRILLIPGALHRSESPCMHAWFSALCETGEWALITPIDVAEISPLRFPKHWRVADPALEVGL